MNTIPRVSIILPNYNYAEYLDQRIQSLLDQTFRNFELIIIDDASSDNSAEVIKKYESDKRIKTFFHKKNSGLTYKRWNEGAELSVGKYLMFAGADDSCENTLLEKLVEKLDSNKTAGLAYVQSWEINNEGKKIRTLKFGTDFLDKERWKKDFTDKGKNECYYLLFQNTIPNASAVLLRRKNFFESGKFDESFLILADWLLWFRILLNSDVAFIAEPLNYYRKHSVSVCNKSVRNGIFVEERYKIISFILKHLKVPKEVSEQIFENQMNVWTRRIISKDMKIPIKRNLEIYRSSRHLDPKTNVRFIKKMIKNLMRK